MQPPIAIIADPTPPAITTSSTVRGKSAGAQSGMARGAGVCAGLLTQGIAGPALALACLPFGLAIGGATGAASSAELVALEQAEASLKQAFGSALVPDRIVGIATAYATEHGVVVSPIRSEVRATVEIGIAALRAETPGTEKLAYRFTVVLRGRLLEGPSARQLDTFERSVSTRQYTFSQWTEDGGRRVIEELQRAARYGVEAFIDEWVLVDRGELERADRMNAGDISQLGLPPYVLVPTQPTAAASADPFARQLSPAAPSFDPHAVTFGWEAWPRSFAGSDRFAGVHYELRVYRAPAFEQDRKLIQAPVVEAPLAAYAGIKATQFTLPAPLEPCQNYYWTVRATFQRDGLPRATEWSGMYGDVAEPRLQLLQRTVVADPSAIRRNETALTLSPWLPFRTLGPCS